MKTNAEITPDVAAALGEMRAELDAFRLEVILVPQRIRTNEGGMVRCAVSKNAPWYRRLCARHPSSRRRRNAAFDTKIKRRGAERVLTALLEGKPTASQYAVEILGIARARKNANPAAYALALACNEPPF